MLIKKFAFDLDGTLVNGNGEVCKGVTYFFFSLLSNIKNPNITICTGNNKGATDEIVDAINRKLKENYDISDENLLKPEIITFGGAQIFDKDGNLIKSSPLTKDNFLQIEKIVRAIDKKAILFANTESGLIYRQPKLISTKNIIVNLIKSLTPVIGLGKHKISQVSQEEFMSKLDKGEIFSLEILSVNSKLKKEIFNNLNNIIKDLDFSRGATIEVCNGKKVKAISHNTQLENIMFVGDGYNDISCLKGCGISFALGKKLEVLNSAKYAVDDFTDIYKAIFCNEDLTEFSKTKIKKIENAKILKQNSLLKDIIQSR